MLSVKCRMLKPGLSQANEGGQSYPPPSSHSHARPCMPIGTPSHSLPSPTRAPGQHQNKLSSFSDIKPPFPHLKIKQMATERET